MINKILIGLLIVAAGVGSWYFLSRQNQGGDEPPEEMVGVSEDETRVLTSHNPDDPGEECPAEMTPVLTEGPYYQAGSPERNNLAEGVAGEVLTITGHVFDQSCGLVSHAWFDFWQADGKGIYDNSGFTLRGHQFTDSTGHFELTTVMPGEYPGRTPHIHVKVRASEKSPVMTTQLFFPGEAQNQSDSIFDQSLVLFISTTPQGKAASFNFKVPRE